MLSRFHQIPERNGQTEGQTDRRTNGQICYINIARQYADARLKMNNYRISEKRFHFVLPQMGPFLYTPTKLSV